MSKVQRKCPNGIKGCTCQSPQTGTRNHCLGHVGRATGAGGASITIEDDQDEGVAALKYKSAKDDPYFRGQRSLYDADDIAHLSADDEDEDEYNHEDSSDDLSDEDEDDSEVMEEYERQAIEDAEDENEDEDEDVNVLSAKDDEADEDGDRGSSEVWHIRRETDPKKLVACLKSEDEEVKIAAMRNPRMPISELAKAAKKGRHLESIAANPSVPRELLEKLISKAKPGADELWGAVSNPNKSYSSLVAKARKKLDEYMREGDDEDWDDDDEDWDDADWMEDND